MLCQVKVTFFWSRFERGDGEGNPQLDQVPYLYRQPPSMQSLLSLCQATASRRQTEFSAGFPPTAADCPQSPFSTGSSPKYWWMLMYSDAIHFSIGSKCVQSFWNLPELVANTGLNHNLKFKYYFILTDLKWRLEVEKIINKTLINIIW